MAKKRLDIVLVEKGFFPSREQARTAIMSKEVEVNNKIIDKAGTPVADDAKIRILGEKLPFVSRGGYKLDKAVKTFGLDLTGLVMMDVGASTGGFTDCALQNGAAKVYAVDVGYGQLAWNLRNDERVVVLEKTNARYLDANLIPEALDMVTIDASFISLTKLLPAIEPLLKDKGQVMALIKPQFEAGREKVGKKGVVRDFDVHIEVIKKVVDAASELGLNMAGITFSPITGPEGNIEYLLWLKKGKDIFSADFKGLTEQAAKNFGR
ncbi:MAG: TlyA family RNA methyltransferase [Clostridia bacterium]|jgi:23S rRNA (cytidine1920-2'-O)/16S rRNA (cytidine1409-2'-O)-methyltransferase|nr:TlyA family RNA methyltransferase [Clostridia bacterium]